MIAAIKERLSKSATSQVSYAHVALALERRLSYRPRYECERIFRHRWFSWDTCAAYGRRRVCVDVCRCRCASVERLPGEGAAAVQHPQVDAGYTRGHPPRCRHSI